MKNGNKISSRHRHLLLIITLFLVGSALLAGCKSSRKVVEETRTETHYTGRDSTRIDSVLLGGNERSSEGDTSNISADMRGSVEIKRDSGGRPIFIYWTYWGNLSALSKRNTEKDRWFFGLNATRHSESSGAVDSVNEKTEETAEEIDTAISLESLIGSGLLGLILLYLIYLFFTDIVWPWIKQKRGR